MAFFNSILFSKYGRIHSKSTPTSFVLFLVDAGWLNPKHARTGKKQAPVVIHTGKVQKGGRGFVVTKKD